MEKDEQFYRNMMINESGSEVSASLARLRCVCRQIWGVRSSG